jgi:hypothetical protein
MRLYVLVRLNVPWFRIIGDEIQAQCVRRSLVREKGQARLISSTLMFWGQYSKIHDSLFSHPSIFIIT